MAQVDDLFDDIDRQIEQRFNRDSERVDLIYEAVNKAVNDAYKGLTKKIEVKWPDQVLSDRSQWVAYSTDFSQRAKVDFSNGEMIIEAVVEEDKTTEEQVLSAINFGRELIEADTVELEEKDLLSQEINKELQAVDMLPPSAKKNSKKTALNMVIPEDLYHQAISSLEVTAPLSVGPAESVEPVEPSEPVEPAESVESLKVNKKNSPVTDVVALPFTPTQEVIPAKNEVEIYEDGGLTKIRFHIKFVNEFQRILVENYQSDIQKYAQEYGISVSTILAIIETESSFNPRAVSPIPAFGLMQLVPRTAGVDAYQLVHGKQQVVSPDFLFNEKNNLQLGSAYFYLLMNRYLKHIKDDVARFYCSVVSYNTGVGNMSLTFVGVKNIKKAVTKINTMTSEEVYDFLLKNLPAKETVNYLQKIVKRRDKYKHLDI